MPGRGAIKPIALAGMGRYSESIEALDHVINLTSNTTMLMDAWRGKAVAYSEGLHDFNKSLEAWDKALVMIPSSDTATLSTTLGARAMTLEMAGRSEEAAIAYQKVIDLRPGDSNAWIGKGNALISLNRSAEAEEAFDEAINASSGSMYWAAWFGKEKHSWPRRSMRGLSRPMTKSWSKIPPMREAGMRWELLSKR